MRFTILHLILITLLAAIYLTVRTEIRSAIIILPLCAGAYSAWCTNQRCPSIRSHVRASAMPTVLMTLALLLSEMVVEIAMLLIRGQWNTQWNALTGIGLVCLTFALYALIALVGGATVGLGVHLCRRTLAVLRLGLAASAYLRYVQANPALTTSRRACPTCTASPSRLG